MIRATTVSHHRRETLVGKGQAAAYAFACGVLTLVVVVQAVLLRPFVAAFQARGDTTTPMLVGFAAIGLNVALKLALVGSIDVAGLAAGTSAGLVLNLAVLAAIARRRGYW